MSDDKKKSGKAEGVEARLDVVEAAVKKLHDAHYGLVRTLEKLFGIDVNKDGKIGAVRYAFIVILAVMGVLTAAYAADVWKLTGATASDSIVFSDAGVLTVSGGVVATGGVSGPVAATTLTASGASTLSGSVTVIGTSVTSRWDNAASKIDGEQIADDTIDDDSIDWSDVTSTDITFDAGTVGEAAIAQTAWAQSDTNATTLITTYTPQHVGDLLIGYLDGSNWVWVARGVTTNDWQQIAP